MTSSAARRFRLVTRLARAAEANPGPGQTDLTFSVELAGLDATQESGPLVLSEKEHRFRAVLGIPNAHPVADQPRYLDAITVMRT